MNTESQPQNQSEPQPKKNKRFLITALIFIVVLGAIFSIIKYSRGISLLPFGGKVITAIPCTCDAGNFLVTISPPMGGQFTYRIGTQAYLNYNLPMPGVWALGLYQPGSVCMVYVGKGCSAFGTPVGMITPTVGTSLAF